MYVGVDVFEVPTPSWLEVGTPPGGPYVGTIGLVVGYLVVSTPS